MNAGLPKYLSGHRNFDGTVYLIFQPAEEGGGGAREMIKDGLFNLFPMEAIFGAHNWPGMAVGCFAIKPGPVFASSNEFKITIRGKGAHVAMPPNGIATAPTVKSRAAKSASIVSPRSVVASICQERSGATVRQVPDIAFDAASASGAEIFIGGRRYVVSGTSLASPIFTGVFARVQTYANNTIGFPASLMYRDFPGNAAVHDVTTGNNGVSYAGKSYGYNAGTGWDFTTGFGSLDIGKFTLLAYNWGNTSLPPTTNPPPAAPTALTNNVAVSTQGSAGSSQQFTLTVPGGVSLLTLRTTGSRSSWGRTDRTWRSWTSRP